MSSEDSAGRYHLRSQALFHKGQSGINGPGTLILLPTSELGLWPAVGLCRRSAGTQVVPTPGWRSAQSVRCVPGGRLCGALHWEEACALGKTGLRGGTPSCRSCVRCAGSCTSILTPSKLAEPEVSLEPTSSVCRVHVCIPGPSLFCFKLPMKDTRETSEVGCCYHVGIPTGSSLPSEAQLRRADTVFKFGRLTEV